MPDQIDQAQVLNTIIAALAPLTHDGRVRILQTVALFYDVNRVSGGAGGDVPLARSVAAEHTGGFSVDRSASPKDFVHEKNPESETERLVCLAYYLTHYRGLHHFKTLDLTQLNTEAAQIKFSNASATVHSASRQGLIGPAPNGQKQITARGERFVSLLPDREAARSVLGPTRAARRGKRRTSSTKVG